MSEPKRGMVAGQAIQTQAQTKEYDEGYDNTFGPERNKERGRFVWSDELKKMVRVGDDWTDAPRRSATVTEELVYGKLGKSTDGAAIDSRTKHREYMKSKGVTLASDFSPEWRAKEAASKKRADDSSRRETVARAVYTTFKP